MFTYLVILISNICIKKCSQMQNLNTQYFPLFMKNVSLKNFENTQWKIKYNIKFVYVTICVKMYVFAIILQFIQLGHLNF